MKKVIGVATFVLVGIWIAAGATVSAASMTLTGTVSDAMCGARHPVADAAACTKTCVKKGSDYALIVKDKVYTLKANDAAKAELDKLAGKTADVMGDVSGNTVTVKSVKMGMVKKS